MRVAYSVSLLAALVAAAPSKKSGPKPSNTIDLQLKLSGNSKIEAKFTNLGDKNIRLLKSGTILSDRPTRKASVYAEDKEVDFEGLNIFIDTDNLDDKAFQNVKAGKAFSFNFDVAQVHNLAAGGKHKIQATGRLPYAFEGSNKIAGYLKYTSNTIETAIDGAKAASARLNFNEVARAKVNGCSGSKLTALKNAVNECNRLAIAAQEAASSGSAGRMEEYFMSSSESTRSTVADVYSKVQDQCDSTTSGTSASCTDSSGHCDESGALAFTHNGEYMVYCDPFFNDLGSSPSSCHQKSRATTFLHETTHLSAVKRTSDLAYGYDALRQLSNDEAKRNADTYALFSNAVDLDCSIPSNDDEEED